MVVPVGAAVFDGAGPDAAGDAGAKSIGPDDEAGMELAGRAIAVSRRDAGDASSGVRQRPGDRHSGLHRRARLLGGGQQDRVEHVTAGCEQVVDPGAVLDLLGERAALEAEREGVDRRSATGDDLVEESPAVELHDATRERAWVERVSLGSSARSTMTTSSPWRASSIAVEAPAVRAPTTMTSGWPVVVAVWCVSIPTPSGNRDLHTWRGPEDHVETLCRRSRRSV